ncbi:hypothetical protein R1sor_004137 [Riccia sorocarpa]|uniref:FCP1 homology domain-containing protein n=1 Tax=Riccia sorocarpa TaxID=122646 RepID=A0ABD3H3M9_9MARC
MAPKKRPPQAPPVEAPGRKKRTPETTQQPTDAGPSVRHTRQQATGAGPSVQPAGPSVPTSRKKKGAKRPRGEPKKVVNPDAIEGEYLVQFEHIADRERHVRWCYVTGDQRRSALRAVRNRDLTPSGLFAALDLPVHRPHRPQVRLDAALVRAAFVLPAASMEIKRQVRHSLIVDWFREYERNGKRYIARTCLHRKWAQALECICMVLLASRRPRCIPGRLVYFIKKFKMDPEDDPEDRLDFAELMVQSLRRELLEKSLVVRPGDCLVALFELLQKRCHIIVWSRASLKYVTAFLGLMVSKGYLLAFIMDPQVCTLWGGDGVETVRPRRDLEDSAKLKSFRKLYDHGICLRDVLLVDTSPERNSLNDPYSAVHPKAVDKFPSAAESSAWLLRFTDWLATWSENLLPTVDFVRSHGHSPAEEALAEGAAPVEEAGHVEEAPVEGPARVEEAAPVQEAVPVEEAPVEGAAPVKEPTRVEEAPAEGLTRVEEAPAMGLTHE